MKKVHLVIIALGLNLSAFAQADDDYIKRSQQIYEWVRENEFGKVVQEFDTNVAKRVDSLKMATAWKNLTERVGGFVKVNDISSETDTNHTTVIQHSEFEKKPVDFKLVFGKDRRVKGIFFVPDIKKFVYDDPEYMDKEKFLEKRKYLITDEFRLPALLSVPHKVQKPPVAILVHGSGPNDKDETVGNTKIFRDLAVGLASNGIAVLRYDKRTRNYAGKMQGNANKLTVREETIDDVITAIRLAKLDSTLDSTRIFLIGHSLGGMLLPRIAAQSSNVKGIIMLAANARPMEDLILEQTRYLLAKDTASEESKNILDSLTTNVERIKSLDASNLNDTIGILGIPISYWLDLKNYDQVKTASKLKLPMLILHGSRDYQVTDKDFMLWKDGLSRVKNVSFKSYPDLNHLFISGEGKSYPLEYDEPGHLDKKVLEDIKSFILNGSIK